MNSSAMSPFIGKLFDLLADESFSKILSWTDDGESFCIADIHAFGDQILGTHFKATTLQSFIR